MKFSLQLFSVCDAVTENYKNAVRKVGEIGYSGVEFFGGYGGMTSREMKAFLSECGLYACSSHTPYDVFENNFEADLEFHRELGTPYIICPAANIPEYSDVLRLAEVLNKAGEMAAKYGIKVGYHNHNGEFRKMGGKHVLDILAEQTTENVVLELDVYWVQAAGIDIYDCIEKMGSKIELVHLRQMGWQRDNVDIPDGNIDMGKIIQSAKYAKHFIVEQSSNKERPWDSVQNNIIFLKRQYGAL